MRFNFKKISAVASSILLTGMTLGMAAAANYPAPFVSGSSSNVAIVYGTGVGVNANDQLEATNIQTDLSNSLVGAGPSSVSGGDSVKLEKSTNLFNLGDNMSNFFSTLDEDEFSTVLATGVYQNDANDEFDYEQSISLGAGLQLTHFLENDNEFISDEIPIIGFDLADGQEILNYTLEFTPDAAEAGGAWVAGNDLETTDLTLLGRTYYVLSARNSSATDHKLVLLDSANSAIVSEGSPENINAGSSSYVVGIDFIDSDEVILNVNGVQTNKLMEGGTYKVAEDTYVAVKSILYSEKETGVSKAEVSIGSGKIEIENGKEVKINNEDVSTLDNSRSEILATIATTGEDLDSITLSWNLDDDAWIVPGLDLVLPGFETIKLSMGGFNTDAAEETTVNSNSDDSLRLKTTIKDGDVSLDLLYLNSSASGFIGLGEKASHKLVTTNLTNSIVLNLWESNDSYFVATWINGDDYESYAFELKKVDDEQGKNRTTLTNLAGGSDVVLSEVTDDKDVGEVKITLTAASETGKNATVTLSRASGTGTLYADRLVTDEGLLIHLPVDTPSAVAIDGGINISATPTGWTMNFTEEDNDGDIASGSSFWATVGIDNGDGAEVTSVTGVTTYDEEDGSDTEVGYVVSDLATMVTHDKPSNGLNDFTVTYHGTEASADVYILESGAELSSSGATVGDVVVKDSEVSSVSDKNLIIVGGSCINSAAASVLGGANCGAAFTDSTGVGSGQFLIQSFSGQSSGKVSLVVAGYEAADTTAASQYLRTQDVDTTVGKKYVGSSSTSAELVVA